MNLSRALVVRRYGGEQEGGDVQQLHFLYGRPRPERFDQRVSNRSKPRLRRLEGAPLGRVSPLRSVESGPDLHVGKQSRPRKHFRETSLRVQSENVGLAELPDGTRLVRVGDALPGERAAWRYGGELRRRRRGFLLQTGIGVEEIAQIADSL